MQGYTSTLWAAKLLSCTVLVSLTACATANERSAERPPALASTETAAIGDRQQLTPASAVTDPLPSWSDDTTKRTILQFVIDTTYPRSVWYVPSPDRIAVFDDDGTLWVEKPVSVQALFLADEMKQLLPAHPEWMSKRSFATILTGDYASLARLAERDLLDLFSTTNAGVTTDEFDTYVRDWATTATHPILKRRYTELAYQPMLELLGYLAKNAFKTFICTAGDVDFVRAFSNELYGVSPDRVIGNSHRYRLEKTAAGAVLARWPKAGAADARAGKLENIQAHIGRKPIIAVGNSDGDLQVLQSIDAGLQPSLALLVHHDDPAREFDYDRESKIGHLDQALDEALWHGWRIVSMKGDFRTVFPAR